ncbi:hypothetical protein TWF225_000610 [Orbilia oligospora]|nr:hypothetical protein TWF225_000610 [Orbilia oligospora]KAF3268470.1 hypothetical protein TWF217_011056 [Orbilia oligospora]
MTKDSYKCVKVESSWYKNRSGTQPRNPKALRSIMGRLARAEKYIMLNTSKAEKSVPTMDTWMAKIIDPGDVEACLSRQDIFPDSVIGCENPKMDAISSLIETL